MDPAELARIFKSKEGICTGFAPGSSALARVRIDEPLAGHPRPAYSIPTTPTDGTGSPCKKGSACDVRGAST